MIRQPSVPVYCSACSEIIFLWHAFHQIARWEVGDSGCGFVIPAYCRVAIPVPGLGAARPSQAQPDGYLDVSGVGGPATEGVLIIVNPAVAVGSVSPFVLRGRSEFVADIVGVLLAGVGDVGIQ